MKNGEWIKVGERDKAFNELPSANIVVKFDNGATCDYEDPIWPFSEVTHWRIKLNPHPKQILTYDKFGQVDGGFINPAYEEWEILNGKII
jgi:hypothetical protein